MKGKFKMVQKLSHVHGITHTFKFSLQKFYLEGKGQRYQFITSEIFR